MAKVNLVDKKVQMGLDDIVRFQLLTHCYLNKIPVSDLDLDCLTALGILGESELTDFCDKMADIRLKERLNKWESNGGKPKPEASPQTIRNIILKAEKRKLISTDGKSRKKIFLNPILKVQTLGNILLDYKLIRIDTKEA